MSILTPDEVQHELRTCLPATFPPETWCWSHRPSQLQTCCTLGHRCMSVPLALRRTRAVPASMPSMSAAPMSMPAAWGWQTRRASESTGSGGRSGGGGHGARQKALWGVLAASRRRAQHQGQRWGRERRNNMPSPTRDQDGTWHQCGGRRLPRPTSQTGTGHQCGDGHDDQRSVC